MNVKHRNDRLIRAARMLSKSGASCVCTRQIDRQLHLSWCQSSNVLNSLKLILDQTLLMYFHEAQGVLLAYDQVQLLDKGANIIGCDPAIFVKARIRYHIFRPVVDDVMSGKVASCSDRRIVANVFGLSSAIISPSESAPLAKVKTGSVIWFRVKSFYYRKRHYEIYGSQISAEEAKANGHSVPYGCKLNFCQLLPIGRSRPKRKFTNDAANTSATSAPSTSQFNDRAAEHSPAVKRLKTDNTKGGGGVEGSPLLTNGFASTVAKKRNGTPKREK